MAIQDRNTVSNKKIKDQGEEERRGEDITLISQRSGWRTEWEEWEDWEPQP